MSQSVHSSQALLCKVTVVNVDGNQWSWCGDKDSGISFDTLQIAPLKGSRDSSGVTLGAAFVPVILTSQILSALKSMPFY